MDLRLCYHERPLRSLRAGWLPRLDRPGSLQARRCCRRGQRKTAFASRGVDWFEAGLIFMLGLEQRNGQRMKLISWSNLE